MKKIKLDENQIKFLKKEYSNDSLVKCVLDREENNEFEIDVDTKIELMDFLENESVYWMKSNGDPSKKTIMLESIRDSIYNQTN